MKLLSAKRPAHGRGLIALLTQTKTLIAAAVMFGALFAAAATANAQSFSEGFDNVSTLPSRGWAQINRSDPLGASTWVQGDPTVFPAQSGATNSLAVCNFNSTTGAGTISNWLFTPTVLLRNGDVMTFYSRKGPTTGGDFPDRLEVRLSTSGTSTDVGTTADSVGVFTRLLLSINPTLVAGGYPTTWTQYTVTVSGLTAPTNGRFAFRYYVTNGGPNGANSDLIGIDTVNYALVPTAAPVYISGRVLSADGRGIKNAIVTLTGADGTVKTAQTSAFGYYRIEDVAAMGTGILTVSSKKFTFDAQSVNLTDNLAEQNFVAR